MLSHKLVSNLDALTAAEPYEVCVAGSGPAGTIVASLLVGHGVRTLLLKWGEAW